MNEATTDHQAVVDNQEVVADNQIDVVNLTGNEIATDHQIVVDNQAVFNFDYTVEEMIIETWNRYPNEYIPDVTDNPYFINLYFHQHEE